MGKFIRYLNGLLVVTMLLSLMALPVSAEVEQVVTIESPYTTYVYDYYGNPVITPDAYTPDKVISGEDLGVDALSDPSDLEVDEEGNIYLVDTKYAVDTSDLTNMAAHPESDLGGFTGRLIILNADYSVKKVIVTFNNKGKTDGFGAPEGVTIAEDGTIYVADTGYSRILRFDATGTKLLQEFTRPAISYLGDDYSYKPKKLAVDSSYNIFVVAESVTNGIILLDDTGKFAGFVGAQQVTYNVVDYIWKNLLSEEAASRMEDFVPTEYSNVKIDEYGFLYATTSTIEAEDIASALTSGTADTKTSPVKRLNPTGNDVLIRKGYFTTAGDVAFEYTATNEPEVSVIEDVALGPNGRYTILDSRKNRLFTYSSDGELIYAFGGEGYQAGNSVTPRSITYRGTDLLLLDQGRGTITVYTATRYAQLIDEAYDLYKQYKYEESVEKWNDVLDVNANFDIAYDGIGNALMQKEEYREAMENFRYSNNKERYSTALGQHRASLIEDYLLVIVAVVVVLIYLLVKLFGWIGKRNRDPKYQDKHGTFLNQVLYGFYIMIHPFDGFWDVKHEKRGSAKAATAIAGFLVVARIISAFFTNYLFNDAYGTKISIMSEVLIVVMPLLLWTLCNWCVTTLADGEGTIKDVYIFTCYSLLPMALFTIATTVLSHFIILDETMYITFFSTLGVIWSGFLIFSGNTQTHRYTVSKSILSILMAVVGMAIVVFIGLVIFTTYQQIYSFIDSIVKEVTYRI